MSESVHHQPDVLSPAPPDSCPPQHPLTPLGGNELPFVGIQRTIGKLRPDFNPIELAFAKLTSRLRATAARDPASLEQAMAWAIAST